jgi:hypothetical protein
VADEDERPSTPTSSPGPENPPAPNQPRPTPIEAPPLAVPGMHPGTAYQPGLGTVPLCTNGCGGGPLVGAWLLKGAGVVGGAALILALAPEAVAGAAIVGGVAVVRLVN